MDVINKISKVPGLLDAPVINPREEFQVAHAFYVNGSVWFFGTPVVARTKLI